MVYHYKYNLLCGIRIWWWDPRQGTSPPTRARRATDSLVSAVAVGSLLCFTMYVIHLPTNRADFISHHRATCFFVTKINHKKKCISPGVEPTGVFFEESGP